MAFTIFAQIYSSVFVNVWHFCEEETKCANPFFVQLRPVGQFPICSCPEEMQGSGKDLDYRRVLCLFLILAKAASSSLDTGNFYPTAGE